jgi:hypothetical protein
MHSILVPIILIFVLISMILSQNCIQNGCQSKDTPCCSQVW